MQFFWKDHVFKTFGERKYGFLCSAKYEYLIKKREDAKIKHLNNPNALIKSSNTMDDVYENINDYNPIRKRKRKKLIVFDDMVADIMTN